MSPPHPSVPGQSYSEVNNSHSFQRFSNQSTISLPKPFLEVKVAFRTHHVISIRREGNKVKQELCCRKVIFKENENEK